MSQTLTAIRKAAIFLASLDDATAESLLQQLPASQAATLRTEWAMLESVDDDQQQIVVDEFLGREPRGLRPFDMGLELNESLGRHLVLETPDEIDKTDDSVLLHDRVPFEFLQESDDAQLAEHLSAEHPQAIAMVLAHLPLPRAAVVLEALPASVQQEVVSRLVERDESHPEIVREVERGLESRIGAEVRRQRQRRNGVHLATSLLGQMDRSVSRRLLSGLSHHNPELALHLGYEPRIPLCLDELDERALRSGFQALGEEVFALALAGTTAAEAEHTLRRLPEWEASRLRTQLADLRPTRLSDLELAYRQLLSAAAVPVSTSQTA